MQTIKLQLFVVFCDLCCDFVTLCDARRLNSFTVFPYGLFDTPWLGEWQKYYPFAVWTRICRAGTRMMDRLL